MKKHILILLCGTFFGIVLSKGEVLSWLRIYEMFNFDSFFMYGIIGSAVVFGILLFQLIKRFKIKDMYGNKIEISDKPKHYRAAGIGGIVFGLGWALTGACPGPIFALIGQGLFIFVIVLISALLGTFVYGIIQHKLPK